MGSAEKFAECEGFQWDAANSGKIWERHQVAPIECEEVFFNHPLVVGEDEEHSVLERRLYALGQTDAARLLFVAFTIRGRLIRVVSARDTSRKERQVYRSS
jgi:uncharacterized DUF497 family protein